MSLDITLYHPRTQNRLHSYNVTHNLTEMARQVRFNDSLSIVDLYEVLWNGEEHDLMKAKEIILYLEQAIKRMLENPNDFKRFNSPNGWGTFEWLLSFMFNLYVACIENPEADIHRCR